MITGTCYFPTFAAARVYYEKQGDDVDSVLQKITNSEIYVRREPPLKTGETLTLLDDGLRYGIISPDKPVTLTINDSFGIPRQLSDKVYRIKKLYGNRFHPSTYPIGTKVRLIAGVGTMGVGGHPIKGFVTICRVETKTAEFIGFPWKLLREVKE